MRKKIKERNKTRQMGLFVLFTVAIIIYVIISIVVCLVICRIDCRWFCFFFFLQNQHLTSGPGVIKYS